MIIRQVLACVILGFLLSGWLYWVLFRAWKDEGAGMGQLIKYLLLCLTMTLGGFIISIGLLANVGIPKVIIVKDTNDGVDYHSYYCIGNYSDKEGGWFEGVWNKTDIVNKSSSPLIYYPVTYASSSMQEFYEKMRKSKDIFHIGEGKYNVIYPGHVLKVDDEPYYIFREPPQEVKSNSSSETRYVLQLLPKSFR